ncbi:MAG: sporulation protein YqfD [Acutalibacteraceae bacterium]
MILWRWWRWLFGWVRFEAEGGLCERFLNLLAKEPIELWDIRRRHDKLIACCPARQYRLLRPFARRTGTRFRLSRKSGLPFCLHAMRGRKGLAAGALIAAALYMLLCGRIWVIEIHTDGDEALKAAVADQLEPLGITLGQKTDDVDIAAVRLHAIAQIEEINWLSVHFEGSIAHVEAQRQKSGVPLRDNSVPSNLVASCDGRIVSMQVTSGQAMVKSGEGVVKGDLLVCGAVETTAGTLLRRSSGVIMAQTEHTLSVSVPLEEMQLLPTGTVWKQPVLHAFGLSLPLYTTAVFPDSCEQREVKQFCELRGVTLPIGLTEKQYIERTVQTVVHTQEQAQSLATERLSQRVEEELSGAEITDRELHGCWENGVYTLTGTYHCTENIALEQPMLINEQQSGE